MYKKATFPKTSLKVNKSYQGESIESKMNRIVNNKEPIKDGAPLIYSDRKDGVLPQYDIRTDKWEEAIDKMDYVARAHQAKSDGQITERGWTKDEKGKWKKDDKSNKDTGGESIQATDTK